MQIKHVLVPIDQSKLAERAIDYAAAIVQPQGMVSLLTVVEKNLFTAKKPRHVGEPLRDGFAMLAAAVLPVETAETDPAWENASLYLGRTAERLESLGLRVNMQIAEGDPAERIVEAARAFNVDAIAMSTHGRTGLNRLVMGSVAQKVVVEADCPVFLVPQGALERA